MLIAAAGCGSLGGSGAADADAPGLRLDRSAPYGEVAMPPAADAEKSGPAETPIAEPAAPVTPAKPAPEAPPAQTPSTEPVATADPGPAVSTGGASYRLRPGDTIVIHLRTVQLEQFEMIVDENGDVKLPFIGAVRAAGLTGSELEDQIQRDYISKKIYRYLTVHVLVPTRGYFVTGEVRMPGRMPLVGSVSILQAIATAGGYTDFADPGSVQLIRGGKTTKINAKDIARNRQKDVEIESGDVIKVDRTWY